MLFADDSDLGDEVDILLGDSGVIAGILTDIEYDYERGGQAPIFVEIRDEPGHYLEIPISDIASISRRANA